MEESLLSKSDSMQGSEDNYTQNAIKRMNRLENKINVKDSATMESAYDRGKEQFSKESVAMSRNYEDKSGYEQVRGVLPKLKTKNLQRGRDKNDLAAADTIQL